MITRADLEAAIAECQGERNPNANTCIKLAAFYTILNNLEQDNTDAPQHSYAPASVDVSERYVEYRSGSEFSSLIDGKDATKVWTVMDELMDALLMVMPQLYSGTMQKIRNKTI